MATLELSESDIATHNVPEQGQVVQVRSRQWVVTHVKPGTLPAPAMQLHAFVHDLALQISGPVLGHARSGSIEFVLQKQFRAFVHKHLCNLHLSLEFKASPL